MAEHDNGLVHISSALIRALPHHVAGVIEAIDRFADAEVFHSQGDKIVVVLEGRTSDAVGARLAEIALLDGVVSASLVYEQIETLDSLGELP